MKTSVLLVVVFHCEMEPAMVKSLERAVSQKALQMGSSFPCRICVVGFLIGACLACLFMASLTSFRAMEVAGLIFPIRMATFSSPTSTSRDYMGKILDGSYVAQQDEGRVYSKENEEGRRDGVLQLYSVWGALLDESVDDNEGVQLLNRIGLISRASVPPKAPHIKNCKASDEVNKRLDTLGENGTFPPWRTWKGLLGLEFLRRKSSADEQWQHVNSQAETEASYPTWIVGSDDDNFPLTRKVQKDIWVHQHPSNCNAAHVRFLIVDWEIIHGFGIGAQIAGMCGLLAIAMKEQRVLVTNYYNRADHAGCKGASRSRWSCYFFPETSVECRNRAFELMTRKKAWENGIVTGKDNYTTKEIWAGHVPRIWGNPWVHLQPTTEINGSLITHHRKMDRRWWLAQATRYLMRFQSKYTCELLNSARHKAFGLQAAEMVLKTFKGEWSKQVSDESKYDIEQIVWSNHKPWIQRPILSMHVRMGDKACEMKVVEFEKYMHLADRIRKRFPNLNSIWISTEMQEVIDKLKSYPSWNFYYTNVTRQVGNMSMAAYEASLGRETGTNNPLVNFLMASEADFFIGALGSTWCYLIDGMRNTGGKVMAGYLSVNKDRFW
ncbi:hypothetical protein Scep_010025 [Stephania cephalantha]|uniref:Alpha-(1,6)-fucosyltransferase n=1 Tax=Stephania cephalantha TaxID=152367 RepID=A0AAP0JV24_9MAGN